MKTDAQVWQTHAQTFQSGALLRHTEVYCTHTHSPQKGCVVLSLNSTVFLSLWGPVTHSLLSTNWGLALFAHYRSQNTENTDWGNFTRHMWIHKGVQTHTECNLNTAPIRLQHTAAFYVLHCAPLLLSAHPQPLTTADAYTLLRFVYTAR